MATLTIDPQPRRDLELPPMVAASHPQGAFRTTVLLPTRETDIFAGLDFDEEPRVAGDWLRAKVKEKL